MNQQTLTPFGGIELLFPFSAEVACWMHSGERQAIKMRIRYLEAILRQDVAYFDTHAETGMLMDSVSTDTLMVQDAISEKVNPLPRSSFLLSKTFLVGSTCIPNVLGYMLPLGCHCRHGVFFF